MKTFNKFKSVEQLINRNPVMQFAKKAVKKEPVLLSDMFSPSAVGAGLGQELIGNTDPTHTSNVKRHNIFFNMMKFNMK